MEKIREFYNKHKDLCLVCILFLSCLIFIFGNIGLYPLIDIDETRYVNMSKFMYLTKDYLTPTLNFEPFLEKPPLFFWLNVLAFKILGFKTVFAGRFMTGALGSLSVFFLYFFLRKITKNQIFAFLSSMILLSSAWFLVFTHVAILDLGFMATTEFAILSAVLGLFVQDKNKKYCWYLGYLFMALAVLAKGLIGIAVPSGVVFFTYLIFGKWKELFKPINIIPGIILMFLVALPWHYEIFNKFGQFWVNEYIIKHHFARLLNSEGLGRKQPFLFYVPIILIGLVPYCFHFISILIRDVKKLIENMKINNSIKGLSTLFDFKTNEEKLIAFSYVYFLCVFFFFSSASTKLPPYILPSFPALAILLGGFIYKAINDEKNVKLLKISNYIHSILFLIVSSLGLIFLLIYKLVLSDEITQYIIGAQNFACPSLIFIFITMLIATIFNKRKQYLKVFIINIIFMMGISYIAFGFGIPYYTSFAQDELVEFSDIVQKYKNSRLITYNMSVKYSILNPDKKIIYIPDTKNKELNSSRLEEGLKNYQKENIYIITKEKNKDLDGDIRFEKIKTGKVYKILKVKS